MSVFREILELLLPRLRHQHTWVADGWEHDGVPSWTKRRGTTCGRKEWFMSASYPVADDFAHQWREMS